jgi:tripartite-type tricarboxylate transporter receptor subunit TctC
MKRRNLKAMAVLATAAMALAGCSSSASNSTTAASETKAAETQAAASAETQAASATDFPTKAIDIVVPFKAGGNVDLSCRIIAEELSKELGQPVNVLNKEGGGAIVGQTYALQQKADGYTILALTSSFVTNILGGTTTYGMDDAIPIAEYCFDPEIIVVSADSGINSLEELIEKGKDTPLLNSTPGFSTSHHIASLIFTKEFGTQFEYMHTNGSSEQTVQLAGGHAEVGMTTYGGAASLIDQGKIKVLAICADERSVDLPDVPTVEEAIGQRFVYGSYRGFAVPAGTPDDVVQTLSAAIEKVMASDSVKTQFANSGFPVTYANAEDFSAMLTKDYSDMEAIQDLLQE